MTFHLYLTECTGYATGSTCWHFRGEFGLRKSIMTVSLYHTPLSGDKKNMLELALLWHIKKKGYKCWPHLHILYCLQVPLMLSIENLVLTKPHLAFLTLSKTYSIRTNKSLNESFVVSTNVDSMPEV